MGRRKKGQPVHGWVNFHKPEGMTSTQAVSIVQRLFDAQKAGHAGTLDPLARGVLPIALGEATKTVPYIQDAEKEYSFRIKWGEATNTDDAEGEIIATHPHRPDFTQIQAALPAFMGDIEQIPPQFSAIKIDGQRAYTLARGGEEVDMPSRMVYIEAFECDESQCRQDDALFYVRCGKGTYMRSLARDLAVSCGTVGHIFDLVRDRVGQFDIDDAILLDKLQELSDSDALETALLPLESALADIPALSLDDKEVVALKNGNKLVFVQKPQILRLKQQGFALDRDIEEEALILHHHQAIAIASVRGIEIQPKRLFNL